MKVTCILTSFNRPNWVRQALASVSMQTHKDHQLIVVDESNIFDIRQTVDSFHFSDCEVLHFDVTPGDRAKVNRLSFNINEGLKRAKGDLICYLADDDFYYTNWFSDAVSFFSKNPEVWAAFGKLAYSKSRLFEYPDDKARVLFWGGPLNDPFCRLDHNQIIHRPLVPPIEWNTDPRTIGAPDGLFMREVGKRYTFYPIDSFAAVKRDHHGKNLQQTEGEYWAGRMDGSRE